MEDAVFSEDYPERRAQVPRGLPLIIALQGFSDAGNAVSQLEQFFWEHSRPETLARLNNDLFLDYRARRPTITFEQDHLTDYDPDEIVLSLATDELGSPFLLLSGYEPDFRWERFVDQILQFIDEFEVSITTWIHAIPMPVPHTRPIGVTVSGTRDDLIEQHSVWQPTTKLAATVGHVLEYRLHTMGEEVVGFVLLIPHYLASSEYPDALLASLDCTMSATGLLFASHRLAEQALEFRGQVDEQVRENQESTDMLHGLERRYDDFMREREESESPLVTDEASLPTADQLASELERFLAEHRLTEEKKEKERDERDGRDFGAPGDFAP